jgi:hypothetical protein
VLVTVTLEMVLVSRYITAAFAALALLSVLVWFPLVWLIPKIANVNVRACALLVLRVSRLSAATRCASAAGRHMSRRLQACSHAHPLGAARLCRSSLAWRRCSLARPSSG